MTRPTHGWQRGLQHFNGCLYLPNSVDGTGAWDTWSGGSGTVTHATVGSAYDTQLKRTIWTNDGTTNRELGPRKTNAGDFQFFMGDSEYCGGWYFSSIFRIEAWDSAAAGRIFIGLSASTNAQIQDDTPDANCIGLSHFSTDPADELFIRISSNTAVVTSTKITNTVDNPGILAAGHTFIWEMWAFPNGLTDTSATGGHPAPNTNYKLSIFDTATNSYGDPFNRVKKVVWNTIGRANMSLTAMMAPQCQMSNAADTTVGHYSMSVANVYCTPHSGEMD